MQCLQEGIFEVSGIRLRVMMDQQLAFSKDFHPGLVGDDSSIVPILVGCSRVVLEKMGLADYLTPEIFPEGTRFRVYCEGPSGLFIIAQDEKDLMEAVQWFLTELASKAMSSDTVEISEINKFG